MIEEENKILSFLELGYKIDVILKESDMNEESLADLIIELENKGFIVFEDKNWALTQNGKDVLNERRELLKKLKIEYLYGNINKEDFYKKRKELEILVVEKKKEKITEIREDKETKDKKIDCPKCRTLNTEKSKYCYKCGEPLK